jgi:NAD(P)H dehydrogenase (quinone)
MTLIAAVYKKGARASRARCNRYRHRSDNLIGAWLCGRWYSASRFGSPAAQFRGFIDSLGGLWTQGKLADKVYAGFTSSQTAHGGQETTLLSLYISLMHFGGIIVPPGYTDPIKFADGNPYGVSHITGPDNLTQVAEPATAALTHLAHRVVAIAARLAT